MVPRIRNLSDTSGKNAENDERKINILLNLIGPQGIKIYNNLKKPKNNIT